MLLGWLGSKKSIESGHHMGDNGDVRNYYDTFDIELKYLTKDELEEDPKVRGDLWDDLDN